MVSLVSLVSELDCYCFSFCMIWVGMLWDFVVLGVFWFVGGLGGFVY